MELNLWGKNLLIISFMIPGAFCPELRNIQPEVEKLLLYHSHGVHGSWDVGETWGDPPLTCYWRQSRYRNKSGLPELVVCYVYYDCITLYNCLTLHYKQWYLAKIEAAWAGITLSALKSWLDLGCPCFGQYHTKLIDFCFPNTYCKAINDFLGEILLLSWTEHSLMFCHTTPVGYHKNGCH